MSDPFHRLRRSARLATGRMTPDRAKVADRVREFTMTSDARVAALDRSVEHCVSRGVPGAFVECGVWKGGSVMAMALVLQRLDARRQIHLFDTFTGMVAPNAEEADPQGLPALEQWSEGWFAVGLAEVRSNVLSTGYDPTQFTFVAGPVEETLPARAPETIALLRLDTDWYESTYHELVHLYPRLERGGVLIIDDYGHWSGARAAVDDYFAGLERPPRLEEIDYTAQLCIKP